MVEEIFNNLSETFDASSVKVSTNYYFSLEDIKKTVFLDPQGCIVKNGKAVAEADCVCKTSKELFLKIWNEGYRPGMKDFLSGAIKSNNPGALKDFLVCFGKEA
jgi:putative sterol carrier protein